MQETNTRTMVVLAVTAGDFDAKLVAGIVGAALRGHGIGQWYLDTGPPAIIAFDASLLPRFTNDVLDQFATMMRQDAPGKLARLAVHVGQVTVIPRRAVGGPAASEVLRLLDSPILDEALVGAPPGTTGAVLVSPDFIDAAQTTPLRGFKPVADRTTRGWLHLLTQLDALPYSAASAAVVLQDGRLIVTGHRDGTVRRWDVTTGALVDPDFATADGGILAIVVMPDGQLSFVVDGPDDGPTAMAASPDGAWIVAGRSDGSVRIADAAGGSVRSFTMHNSSVRALAISPDSTEVVTASAHGTIRRLRLAGATISGARHGYFGEVRSLAVTPDCQQLLILGDGNVNVTDLRSGRLVHTITSDFTCATVAPYAREIISGHLNGLVRLWDLDTGRPIGEPLRADPDRVRTVTTTPDGRMIIAAGDSGVPSRWDATTGERITGTYQPSPDLLADVVSDLETETDALGMAEDVHTLAAMLAALSTKPPLSVALLGSWGAGKSSFMRQLRAQVDLLARSSARAGRNAVFAANLRQVTFNAWHYSDDHLWVGLIEHLFRELATPLGPVSGELGTLEARLDRDQAERQRLERGLQAVQRIEAHRGWFSPVRSALVFRAVLRTGGWRLVVSAVLLLAGLGAAALAVRYGQAVLTWIAGAVALLGPVFTLLQGMTRYADEARAELVDRRTRLDEDIRATTEQLDELDPSRRLDRLLTEISTADRYASFRGLTGRIHHDLRRLSEDLAAARERWDGTGTPPLQRIVLYVDDLDRCTPARVVDVLQALNLLLTMDLFMVVVAVDPEWLVGSLRAHHGELLAEQSAGPAAYLDKIFHIPFALRPMGDHAADLLRSLLPPEPARAIPAPRPATPPATAPPVAAPAPVVRADPPAVRAARASVRAEGLRVHADERDFLARLTPLLPTPRAVKKLANLYRLLRLSLPPKVMGDFLAGQYQVAALLLAALTGAPHEARTLLTCLDRSAEDVVDAFRGTEIALAGRLAELIDTTLKDLPVQRDLTTYREWARVVARYGFETHDLYRKDTVDPKE